MSKYIILKQFLLCTVLFSLSGCVSTCLTGVAAGIAGFLINDNFFQNTGTKGARKGIELNINHRLPGFCGCCSKN